MNATALPARSRLHSLDALKGLDMLFIIGLDGFMHMLAGAFPDSPFCSKLASWFYHCPWQGFSPYDLIFPLFVFLSGISMSLSLKKRMESGAGRGKLFGDMIKRGLILVLIGMIMQGLLSFRFADIRYPSVLGLIGIAYMTGGCIVLWLRTPKRIAIAAAAILSGITALQLMGGNFSQSENINALIDRAILPGRLHGGSFDPEGVLCVISASFLTLAGYLTGAFLKSESRAPKAKILIFMLTGAALSSAAFLLNPVYPIIKAMWTSTFNLAACGFSLILFALAYWIVDVLNWKKLASPFEIIGFNALAIYVGQHFINFGSINDQLFGGIANLASAYSGLILAGTLVLIKWYVLFWMKKSDICIKI